MNIIAATAGAAAVRSSLEVLRAALDLAKSAQELLPDGDRKDQVGEALEVAMRTLGEGEAAIGDAMGYQLCLCQFPPTPMLRVGHVPHRHLSSMDIRAVMAHCVKGGGLVGAVAVHACLKCKQTDAPAYPDFIRDKKVDSPRPLFATPPEPPRPPPQSASEGWGW